MKAIKNKAGYKCAGQELAFALNLTEHVLAPGLPILLITRTLLNFRREFSLIQFSFAEVGLIWNTFC